MTQYDLNLRDYWRVIRRRKAIVIFVPLLFGSVAFGMAVFRTPAPLYRATATVVHERAVSTVGLLQELITYNPSGNLQTKAALIKSFPVISRAAKRLGLIPEHATRDEIRASPAYLEVIQNLPGSVTVNQVGNTSLIEIHVTSLDPEEAARIANSFAEAFQEHSFDTRNRQVREARNFIERQLRDVGLRLRESEEQLRAFQESKEILLLTDEARAASTRLATQEVEHEQITRAIRELELQLRVLKEGAARDRLPRFSADGVDPGLDRLYAVLSDLTVERENLLLTLRPAHPQVRKVTARIANVRRSIVRDLSQALSSKLQLLRARARVAWDAIARLKANKATLPEAALEMARMQREVKVSERIFSLLKERLQEALIKEKEQVMEVSVVKPAMVPSAPINSERAAPKGAVGLLVGLVLGLVLAFIAEAMDTSIGAIDEVEALLESPVLGAIPHLDVNAELSEDVGEAVTLDEETRNKYSFLISLFIPRARAAEAFRVLRTNLLFSNLQHDSQTIMVTSTAQMEGKTTVAINLAITLAQLGKKTLLVEADLRNPFVHHAFGIPKEPGLAEVVLGTASLDEVTLGFADLMLGKAGVERLVDSPGFDKLFLLPSGYQPPNPSELLSSPGLEAFLAEARQRYDYVILDSTPILPVADSTVLGSRVDGTLAVVQVGRVPRAALRRAKVLLESAKARLVGVCLTGVRAELSPDYANMAYYHYRYGSEPKKKKTAPAKRRLGALWGHRKRILGGLGVLLALGIGGTVWQAGHVQVDLRQPYSSAEVVPDPVQPPPAPYRPRAEEQRGEAFTVQLHAFKSEEKAGQVVAAYRRMDLEVFSAEAVIPGKGQWWRVLIGEFRTRPEAQAFGRRLIQNGTIQNFGVVRTPGAEQ
ncbi:MAG: SPOR domain-containing protein [Candidatus Methylomirabilales bacterium]